MHLKIYKIFPFLFVAIFLYGCSQTPKVANDAAPVNPPSLGHVQDAVPKVEPKSKYGNPASYKVFGKRYYVKNDNEDYEEVGLASWYGTKFHGKRTSSGEPYDMYKMTAAHKTLSLPAYVRVTHLGNNKSVIVRVNDRGPFHQGRIIDLSYAAAHKLGITATGTAKVRVEVIDPTIYAKEQRKKPKSTPQFIAANTTTPKSKSTEYLYLQVGAFGHESSAKSLASRLQPLIGSPIEIKRDHTKSLYRVHVGPLDDHSQAAEVKEQLLALNVETPILVNE